MNNILTSDEIEQIYKLETNRISYLLRNLDNSLNKKNFKSEKDMFLKMYNNLSEVFDCSESLISKMIIKEMNIASSNKEYKRLFKLNSLLLIITD